MAKKIVGFVKLQVPAGKANPSPPIGPALGQRGLNIMEFCKAFNAQTQGVEPGLPLPVVITAFADKSFTFIIKTPPATTLIKKAIKLDKGSARPHVDKVGKITRAQLEEIAKIKVKDLTAANLDAAVKTIADFKGKRICFVDPASTSGTLYPTAGLLAAGIDPAKESTQFAGGHPQAVQAVNKGTCDVGFAYDDILDKDVPAGKISGVGASDVKVVWKSGLIAGSPMAVRLNMPQSLVDAVRNIVLNKANKTAKSPLSLPRSKN